MFPGFYLHFSLYETYILVKLLFNYSAHTQHIFPISLIFFFFLVQCFSVVLFHLDSNKLTNIFKTTDEMASSFPI